MAFKLVIFYDIYAKVDISQEILLKAFPNMLIGLAINYYDLNTRIRIIAIFDKVCKIIQICFEGVEYKKSILFK